MAHAQDMVVGQQQRISNLCQSSRHYLVLRAEGRSSPGLVGLKTWSAGAASALGSVALCAGGEEISQRPEEHTD